MFICTSSHVYVYDLQRQCLVKKLFNGGQSMSCIASHAGGTSSARVRTDNYFHSRLIEPVALFCTGDNLIVGGSDGKLAWWKHITVSRRVCLFVLLTEHNYFRRFDMDLSNMPYKVMASHSSAIKVRFYVGFRYTSRVFYQSCVFHRASRSIKNIRCLPRRLTTQLCTFCMEKFTRIWMKMRS